MSEQSNLFTDPAGTPEFGSTSYTVVQSTPIGHPIARFFHIFFKLSAMFIYLFCSIFLDNFILVFVVCVLLLAFDFWTVKNVSGRLLVGLRWWNEVKEDGSNLWIFESKPESRQVDATDKRWFWVGLYATPIVWIIFGIGALTGFRFQWLLIVAVALVLSCTNVVGYWKCQKDAGRQISTFIAQQL